MMQGSNRLISSNWIPPSLSAFPSASHDEVNIIKNIDDKLQWRFRMHDEESTFTHSPHKSSILVGGDNMKSHFVEIAGHYANILF